MNAHASFFGIVFGLTKWCAANPSTILSKNQEGHVVLLMIMLFDETIHMRYPWE